MTGQRIDPGELRARMVQRLAANSYLAQWEASLVPWRPALAAAPRHRYIPDTVWIDNADNGPTLLPLHRDDDPDRWLELTYADDAVITQIDDGRPAGPGLGGAMPTSSASSPIMVAVMLAALDAAVGHRVPEIGTGTGYNAALLAYRLGAEHVTSIEVDPEVAAQARKALSEQRRAYADPSDPFVSGTRQQRVGEPPTIGATHWAAWVTASSVLVATSYRQGEAPKRTGPQDEVRRPNRGSRTVPARRPSRG